MKTINKKEEELKEMIEVENLVFEIIINSRRRFLGNERNKI